MKTTVTNYGPAFQFVEVNCKCTNHSFRMHLIPVETKAGKILYDLGKLETSTWDRDREVLIVKVGGK